MLPASLPPVLAKRAFAISAFALVCFVGLLALDQIKPFAYVRLRNLYRDAITRAGRKTSPNPNLVFLAIDSDSVSLDQTDLKQLFNLSVDNSEEARALGLMSKSWPWPREVYSLILERLVHAGARAVAFDLTFPKPSDGDGPFRAALDRFKDRVVIGSNFVDGTMTRPAEALIAQTVPLDERVGYTNFWPDEDNVVRRAQYRATFEFVRDAPATSGSERFLSLAARVLTKAGFAADVPADLNAHLFRFTGAPGSGFPARSVFEIFVPDYWKHNYQSGEFFRDKIVLIGAEGNWQHDEHQTPLGFMAGPELHLNAMNAALHHEFVSEMSPRAVFIFTALAAIMAVTLSLLIRSPWLRFVALLGICSGAVSLALIIFNRGSLFVPMLAPMAELNLTVVFGLVSDFTAERREKTRLRHTLERYVSRDVVREMLDRPKIFAESVDGAIKPATILFSDLRGFSSFAAQSEPKALVAQLNEYFGAMVECVFRFGGTLDKFVGDAVMAVWGNVRSEGVGPDAVAAVHAALAMRIELANLNRKWLARGWPQLRAGIAINHGEVVVGNIGSPQRLEFTVIGEAVNVSWKLQELTKKFGCDFIVSETVQRLVGDCINLRAIGFADLPGSEDPVEVFTAASSAPIDSRADVFPRIERAQMELEIQRVT
jgi:adenylate cyclase